MATPAVDRQGCSLSPYFSARSPKPQLPISDERADMLECVGDAAQGHKHFALKRNKQQFMGFGACCAQASGSPRRR